MIQVILTRLIVMLGALVMEKKVALVRSLLPLHAHNPQHVAANKQIASLWAY